VFISSRPGSAKAHGYTNKTPFNLVMLHPACDRHSQIFASRPPGAVYNWLSMAAQPASAAPRTPAEPPFPSIRYSWYVVAVLTAVYVFSFIDRQILAMLVRPIRRDLGISDTEMSVLMGFSFALFYTFFGVFLGRFADTRSRRTIIAIGLAAWSAFTAGCGLARNYVQMLALRIGVGVGEAALSPAAYSMITDYFPKERLATALSVYSMAIYIGSGLAYLLGGLIVGVASKQEAWMLPIVGATRPWQVIFFVVGLPGIAFALLMLTVREPVRRGRSFLAGKLQSVPMRQVYAYIFRNRRTFLLHNIGFGLLSLASYGSAAWIPEFFRRTYHWEISKTGLIYGTIVAIFGSLGIVSAGRIADWMRERGTLQANMKLGMLVALLAIPIHCLTYLAPSGAWAAFWLIPGVMLAAAPFGIAPAAIQQMMPNPMRGQASAVYLFILNLIGLGLGPTAVAAVTQYAFGRDDAVNYSLAIVACSASLLAAMLLWLGLKPFLKSLDRLREWNA
jgi:MFS family permease